MLADLWWALLSSATAVGAPTARGSYAVDPANPRDHLRMFLKLSASLELGAQTLVAYEGTVFGARGTDLVPLYGMSGLAPTRILEGPGESLRVMASEASVFTDLATGEPLERWANPYTGREVEVWHLRNGPLNYALSPDQPASSGGWRMLRPAPNAENRFVLPVSVAGDAVTVPIDVQAKRPSPLDPAVWKLESSGAELRYSEHNTWFASLSALRDPSLPSVPARAAWHSLKPWRPWMLMGDAPGCVYNHLVVRKLASLDEAPRPLTAWWQNRDPSFLTAPGSWTAAYKTDWDYFKAGRTPAS